MKSNVRIVRSSCRGCHGVCRVLVHMDGEKIIRVNCHPPTFWKSVVTGQPCHVRGIWIVGSNPLLTDTQGPTIEKALRDHMEYTVVSDLFMTPTAQLADLVLPAAHWHAQDLVRPFPQKACTDR